MAFSTPSYGQGATPGYTAAQDRSLVKANVVTAGVRRLIPASGGAMQGDLAVTSSGSANATVNIGLGDCFIDDGAGGFYFSTNATAVATAAFTANSSGATRTDLVYVQVTDSGVGNPTIAVSVAAGSTTVPAKAIGLATVAIPNGFTVATQVLNAWITDVRKKAQTFDLSVTNTSAVATPVSGNLAFDTSAGTGTLKFYNNSGSWVSVVASDTGITNANLATGNTLVYSAASAPASPTDGSLWHDTTVGQLYIYRSSTSTWYPIARTQAGASWTPTLSNLSPGNGTTTATYEQYGRQVNFNIVIAYGSTAPNVSGAMRFTLPVAPRNLFVCTAALYAPSVGAGFIYDMKGMPATSGGVPSSGSSTVTLFTIRVTPSLATSTDIKWVVTGAGTPFTSPASGDVMVISGSYEAAS
jgi:hypothetical protein